MAASIGKNTCQLLVVFSVILGLYGKETRLESVIALDKSSWRKCLEGDWFVEFYAPWCPACQNFAAKYEEFAKHAPTHNVKVAKVDITENPSLSGRFLVTSLPTIYYLRDGEMRHYRGGRGLQDLLNYIRNEEWKADQPVSWYKAPSSLTMTIVSWFFELSVIIRDLHDMMVQEFGIPVWGSYVIFAIFTLISGLALGMVLVLLGDCLCPPKPRRELRPTPDKYDKLAAKGSDSSEEENNSSEDESKTGPESSSSSGVRARKPRKDT